MRKVFRKVFAAVLGAAILLSGAWLTTEEVKASGPAAEDYSIAVIYEAEYGLAYGVFDNQDMSFVNNGDIIPAGSSIVLGVSPASGYSMKIILDGVEGIVMDDTVYYSDSIVAANDMQLCSAVMNGTEFVVRFVTPGKEAAGDKEDSPYRSHESKMTRGLKTAKTGTTEEYTTKDFVSCNSAVLAIVSESKGNLKITFDYEDHTYSFVLTPELAKQLLEKGDKYYGFNYLKDFCGYTVVK